MTLFTSQSFDTGTLSAPKWITQALYKCDHCGCLSIATYGDKLVGNDNFSIDSWITALTDSVKWIPNIGVGKEFPDVPLHIASAASEAHECASIGANRAAILMARTVIEASAKSKGITKGTLHEKIEEMAKQDVIRQVIVDAAMGVKDFGNQMAHGGIEMEVTSEDVDDTLSLMSVVLNEVFQVEAQTRSLRAKVNERKKPASEAASPL